MADDDLTVRLRALGARPFKRDMDRSARSIDNLGDQAGQAARKMRSLNRQTGNARLSLGPVSLKAKHAGLAFGALSLLTGKASTALLGFAEASATAIGGAGAAGGVGLTALAQGMGTVKLATAGLSDALGGNEEALAKLNPAQARFVAQLQEMQPLLDTLRASASGGLLGGAGKGLRSASKNFGVLNKIVKGTSGTLGGLASKAGKGLGSKRAGKDLATMGATNVRIIDSLGNATLSLASAIGNVLVEAGPLAVWLADAARKGAALTDTWTTNARATGRLADFFARAKTNLSQLGSIMGHTGAGIINLFGAKDVDGTKTLASLDRITARFEAWTKSPAVAKGFGQAIVDQIPQAAGAVASALAKLLGAAAPQAAEIFLKAFFAADAWGKALIAGLLAKRLGLFKLLGGGKGGLTQGIGSKLVPVNVFVTNPGFVGGGTGGVGGAAGKGSKLGRLAITAGKVSIVATAGLAILEGVKAAKKAVGYTPSTPQQRQAARFGTTSGAKPGHVKAAPPVPARSMPNPFADVITKTQIYLDSRQIAEAVHRHDAREKARH